MDSGPRLVTENDRQHQAVCLVLIIPVKALGCCQHTSISYSGTAPPFHPTGLSCAVFRAGEFCQSEWSVLGWWLWDWLGKPPPQRTMGISYNKRHLRKTWQKESRWLIFIYSASIAAILNTVNVKLNQFMKNEGLWKKVMRPGDSAKWGLGPKSKYLKKQVETFGDIL